MTDGGHLALVRMHVEQLCKAHKAANVAKAINVSQSKLSEFRSGKNDSQNIIDRVVAVYPLPVVKAQLGTATKGSTKSTEWHDESVWLNMATGQAVDLTRAAEDSMGALDEVDRLVLSTSYQALRRTVLDLAPALDLGSVLLDLPTEGPSVMLANAQKALFALIAESEVRQGKIDGTVSSELWRRHSQFREQLRRKLERFATSADVSDLLKLGAWSATVRSLSALFRDNADLRVRVVDALRQGDELAKNLAGHLDRIRSITFPCTQYQRDPVGFVRDILGDDPWQVEGDEDDQVTFIESVRDHKRVVAPSARSVGKTRAVAWLALWWRSVWPDGRVCISNFTGNQLRTQDWAEILRCIARAGICLGCRQAGVKARPCPHSQVLDIVDPAEVPTTGIWSDDKERFIVGITGKEATALGGYHGEHLLVICDEFSGLTQEMFDAWRGNITGPECRFVGPGNCLDGPGSPMHDAVTDERIRKLWGWKVVNLSAEVASRTRRPYLPDAAELRILEQEDDRGKLNPLYMINAQGRYPTLDEQCIYHLPAIIKAQLPDTYSSTPAVGPLVIPIDPAGESGLGDEAVIGALRGLVCLEKKVGRGWSLEDYLDHVIDLIERHRAAPNEVAIVAIDADGVGSKVLIRLDNYLASKRLGPGEKVRFEIVPVYLGQLAPDRYKYDLVGDEAHAHLARWLKAGGVFREDHKLQQEMQISKWYPVRRMRDERQVELLSATRKDGPHGYRSTIHRSPDRLDMLRIFAYVSYMRDVLAVPDDTADAAKQDASSLEDMPAPDEAQAFQDYMVALRGGRLV